MASRKNGKVRTASKLAEKFEADFDLTVDTLALKNLTDRIHFDLKEGMIWLDARRVLILQAEWFNELRSELIALMGHHQARGLLTRLGYAAGCRDAQLALKLHSTQSWRELLLTGGRLHALQGSVAVVPLVVELDPEMQHCYLEFLWKHSVEDQSDSATPGMVAEPACWMEIGYASGFMTTCLGAPVVVREVECLAMGHPVCRSIARFADEWDEDISEDLKYLTPFPPSPEALPNRMPPPRIAKAIEAARPDNPEAPDSPTYVIGRSAAFNAVLHQVHRVADTKATVLLLGESGVGKSAFAKEVHFKSRRRDGPFIEVNCAAIPETLLEAELFGVEKGAYTGAGNARTGRFEEAEGGTLFLDEIGTLSLSAQGKILRALQNQQFERLGSSKTIRADVRLVAATNEDLQKAVEEGRFRLDLFYRLNVFPIEVPPLRDRKEDLPTLISYFIGIYTRRHERQVAGVTPKAYQALLAYNWPGNIRELENIIERAVILCPQGEALDMVHLFANKHSLKRPGMMWLSELGVLEDSTDEASPKANGDTDSWVSRALNSGNENLFDIERKLILAAIKEAGNNVAKAAKRLGVSRGQLDYRLKKWGLEDMTEERET